MLFYIEKGKKPEMEINYTFSSLLVYNNDHVVSGKKLFRQVFDRNELTYLGIELSFRNKKYDERDWKAQITLKAFLLEEDDKKGDLICTIDEQVNISEKDHEFIFDSNWGNKKRGEFWNSGNYIWEAYIDGELVGEMKFYIEAVGRVTASNNPYFEFISFKTYEGPGDDVDINDRTYLKKFDVSKTRYIFGEFRFRSKLSNDWLCELFFNYFSDTGILLGTGHTRQYILTEGQSDGEFFISIGWGAENTNNWDEDEYTVELVFQDTLIAVAPFSVGDSEKELTEEESRSGAITDNSEDDGGGDDDKGVARGEIDKASLNETLADLNKLVGLKEIKKNIQEHIRYLEFLKVREEMGYEEDDEIKLHSVFTGNPGTGKTTVVKLLGKIYKSMGLLSKGHVHSVEASDLISGYVRQSGPETKKQIKQAKGGILFIDEAYMLFKKGAENDFGSEAVAALITEMSDGDGDIAIMVAGYPKEMKDFLNSNPGLKSRFRHYFHFDDFTPDELVEIVDYAANEKEVEFSTEAMELLEKEIIRAFRKRDKTFGNARFVHSLVEDAKMHLGIRVVSTLKDNQINEEVVKTIEKEDVQQVFDRKDKNYFEMPVDQELLAEALDELDDLIGLDDVKQEIRNLIKLTRYYREIGKDIRTSFAIHSVYLGNPGTGKTTIARLIGKVYKALGILERGHLVESDASDMIAGYVGQSAIKTKERIEEAMGGVLFIDEAYSMTEGRHNQFGKKAIATLLKQMEDRRGEFAVIVAGYPEPMDEFLKSNPGLKSRFEQTFNFGDFTADDLLKIAELMLARENLKATPETLEHLKNYLEALHKARNKYFGNARTVRKIIEKSVRNQNLRMASMEAEDRSDKIMHTLELEDVLDFSVEKNTGTRQPMGFRLS